MAETEVDEEAPSSPGVYVRSRLELRNYIKQLDEGKREFLSTRTEDVLSAHGDIQEEHRDQASRLLRAYAGGVGLIIAGFGLASTVLRQVSFPNIQNKTIYNPQVLKTLVIIIIAVSGGILVFRSFLRFAGTIELVVQILTPEEINNDSIISTVFSKLPFYPGERSTRENLPFRSEAREGVRRVVEARDLMSIATSPEFSEIRILTEQVIRAQHNEVVINYNMTQLSHIYEIISKSLLDALAGSFLLSAGLIILTTV